MGHSILQISAKFANNYDFKHITSSSFFAQSNGQVERMVRTVKQLLKQSADPYLALMSYRATPLPWCDLSPTKLLMGRRIRTSIPQITQQFVPEWSYLQDFRKKDLQLSRNRKRTVMNDTESSNCQKFLKRRLCESDPIEGPCKRKLSHQLQHQGPMLLKPPLEMFVGTEAS